MGLTPEFFAEPTTVAPAERRRSSRFPVERAVRYRVISRRADVRPGEGRTVNMSSNGVLFSTRQNLVPGKRVEIAISWPAQLNDTCPLKLVAKGRVIRAEAGHAALEIQQYEFRTMGSKNFA